MSAEARHHYPTNLSDEQWALIEPLLPAPKSGAGLPGRPVVDRRRLLDAILYVVKTGCQWRMLPSDLGAWSTAYLNEPTVADAILDRLVHNAYTLNLSGESMRRRQKP